MKVKKKATPPWCDLNRAEDFFQKAKMVVTDVETTGLDWRKDKSVGYVLNFGPSPDESFYLPIRHGDGGNLNPNRVVAMLRRNLQRPDVKNVGFNMSFDLKFMHNDDIHPTGPMEDSQINAYLVDERQRLFSLDACCSFMKVQPKKGQELYEYLAAKFGGQPDRNQMGNYWKLSGNDPVAVDYAMGDGISTWQLWEAQQQELDEQNLRRVHALECRLIRPLVRMMIRGIRVDEEQVHYVRGLIAARLDEARAKLPKDFNERAPTNLKKLFHDAGIKDWPTTAHGNPSFTESWLRTTELGRWVIAVRKLSHIESSFFQPLMDGHLWNGRVHCNFNQARGEQFGTITGRLSSNDPNMQAIPKRDEILAPLFRSVFIPDRGMSWASCDYKQIEPKLLAHYGEVKVLLNGFLADPPIDPHLAVTLAAGLKLPDGRPDRETGKRLNQAVLTGAGKVKVAAMIGKSLSEAEKIIGAYFQAMPEIKMLQKQSSDVLRYRGYVCSILGRRARLEDERFAYKALNRLLQCSNADIIKTAIVEIDAYYASQGDTSHLLNNVHDDLVHQFPSAKPGDFKRAVEIMEDFGPGRSVELMLPMNVDVGIGADWAEATFGRAKTEKAFKVMGGEYRP